MSTTTALTPADHARIAATHEPDSVARAYHRKMAGLPAEAPARYAMPIAVKPARRPLVIVDRLWDRAVRHRR